MSEFESHGIRAGNTFREWGSKRGLTSANEETRRQVARKVGIVPHQKRGLAAAIDDTRSRVARAGGKARAEDKESLREAEKEQKQ